MTQSADILLINAHVLTMDDEMNQYRPGAVAIKDDSILAVGFEAEIKTQFSATQVLDCGGKILMPGLINAHTHIPMTMLRGLADDLRLDVWLMGYMMPVEREFVSPDFCQLGSKIACAEFIKGGVTSFADMYYYEDDIAKASADAGLRGVFSQTVMKFPTPDAKSYEDSLAMARDFIIRWKGHPLVVPSVAPHAPYTCTPEILRATAQLAVEFDVPLHTHIAETALEVENMRNENNMPVVPYAKKQGLFEAKVLAAHCVHIDEGEIRSLHNCGAGVAHNPSSNLKLASGFAPVTKMLNIGLNVGIGTDGPASNNDLDMFEEVRLASFVAKAVSNDPTTLPAHQALSMATRLGARALHIGHLTGTLEVGKRADLILVDLHAIHNSPRFERDINNPYAQIVYAAKSTDVSDVMVNGKWLMRDRVLLTLNETELMYQAANYAKRIDSFLMAREQSVFSKLIALGGSIEEESYEVQLKVKIDDPKVITHALKTPAMDIIYQKHYRQYDNYFTFETPERGRLRYREDDFMDEKGRVGSVRTRLTLIGEEQEDNLDGKVFLSRSRYLAPASQPLRFYREYFKPVSEKTIEKDRMRWFVKFKNEEFYINLDTVEKPDLGYFLEIKSRTWSRKDAQRKAELAAELVAILSEANKQNIKDDYFSLLS